MDCCWRRRRRRDRDLSLLSRVSTGGATAARHGVSQRLFGRWRVAAARAEITEVSVDEFANLDPALAELAESGSNDLPTQPIYLYCRSGKRSALAAQTLQNMGFRNVYSVAGGFKAWQESDQPVDYTDAKATR